VFFNAFFGFLLCRQHHQLQLLKWVEMCSGKKASLAAKNNLATAGIFAIALGVVFFGLRVFNTRSSIYPTHVLGFDLGQASVIVTQILIAVWGDLASFSICVPSGYG
jgi:hypothetical protein